LYTPETISRRLLGNGWYINTTQDLDFNLPGDWYFRIGLFDDYDSEPPAGFSMNDCDWSNAFGFKF